MSSAPGIVPNKYSKLDSRFPNQNQALHCWALFNEFILCRNANDGDDGKCADAKNLMFDVCPQDWIDEWNEQRVDGVFAGVKDLHEVEEDDE